MTNQSSPVNVEAGSFESALANGLRLLDRDPASALIQAETLIRLRRDPRIFRLAAAACRKLGRASDAEAAELNGIQAALADSKLERASIAENEGRSLDARAISEEVLSQQPDDLLAMTLRAEAAVSLWELDLAEELLRKVLERAPSFLRAALLQVRCLQRQALPRQAIEAAKEVLRRKPTNLPALTYLSQLLTEVGEAQKTIEVSERLVSLDRAEPDRWVHYAHHLRVAGRGDDARNAFRRALELKPRGGAAWWGLANYYPSSVSETDVESIIDAIPKVAGTQDEATLNLALGLMEGQRGNYERSFHHISIGKKLRLEAFPFDPARSSASIEEAVRAYTPGFFDRLKGHGSIEDCPIFLIGMHRSGSTLVERILGRHSKLEGGGEPPVLPRLVRTFQRTIAQSGSIEEQLASIDPAELKKLGDRYVERARDYRKSDKPFFIDKLNFNWMHLGLIRAALPHARIIDVRRNALDCCWANFKMLFTEGHPASNDLRHIGGFYRGYTQFVEAIAQAAPGGILPVRYEDVVDDIEGQTRRILGFLGLEFEPDCIDFHLAKEAVATASSEQVRQPLNRKGIGSAEPYRPWLGPLIDELGPLAG